MKRTNKQKEMHNLLSRSNIVILPSSAQATVATRNGKLGEGMGKNKNWWQQKLKSGPLQKEETCWG